MNINKENFVKEYKQLCKKYNVMLEPDIMAALLLFNYDEKHFNEMFKETRHLEEEIEKRESPKEFKVIEKYKYKPLCPIGCTDCVHDPAYIYAEEPEWYKELYGDKKPEEVIDDYCKPSIKDNVCYGYDDEDK